MGEEGRVFTESAALYDAIFGERHDAVANAERLRALIGQHARTRDATLLDVACGTGAYLVPFRRHYAVEGVDLDAAMLAVARRKLPGVQLHEADMVDFALGRQFGTVVCLGSSIGYARTLPGLRRTVANLARHAVDGGVVLVEPWFTPEVWEPGRLSADLLDRPDLKIARVLVSSANATVSILDIHYLVATPNGVERFEERHEMGLFTHDEYLAAFRGAGLDVVHDTGGPLGRGLYLGVRREGW